ncbi:hypothetical protein AK88_04291 [Plasmodium fragile]|uniref:Schizont-infected cell agglutination C-terminal domain-containing protein n=1 Tax=Plasmodium fragile TaxID=5857 RepID=A0A0D9QGD5_PLAFR|nr:uncharacterized protein AK88_04291 [Plasmodium fragile]KJP86100.1 hypothetical protein AK88_04291 [Plasmodium fragile]
MSAKELGDILAKYVTARGLQGNDDGYQASLKKDIGARLEEFIQHMEKMEPNMDALGSNCNNYGWQHWADQAASPRVGHNEGDRIPCKFMTIALYFLKRWSHNAGLHDDEKTNDMKLKGYMRCAVVHMFTEILFEYVCRRKWGTFYAWYSVHGMMQDGGIKTSAAATECAMDRLMDITRGTWSMSEEIKEGLRNNATLKSMLRRNKMENACQKKIKPEQTKDNRPLDSNRQTDKASGKIRVEERLNTGLKTVLKKVQKEISRKGGTDPDETDSDEEDTMSDNEEADEQNTEIAGGKYTNSNNRHMNTHTPGTNSAQPPKPALADTGGGRSQSESTPTGSAQQPQAPASPVLPARPPPPPPPSTPSTPSEPTGATRAAAPNGAGQQPTPVPTESNGKETACPKDVQEESLGAGRVSIAFEPGPECKGPAGVNTTPTKDSQKPAPEPPAPPPKAAQPEPATSSSGAAAASPGLVGPPGEKGATGDEGKPEGGGANAVVDGGNDDPPPLNPPKPETTNPNPDQSGSSGSADGGTGNDQTAVSSGGSAPSPPAAAGGGGTSSTSGSSTINRHDTPRLDLNFGRYTVGVGGSYGPYGKPVTPVGKSTNAFDDTIPPIFTATDIFLSTPVLIFFAFVTSLILLFFLGKSFAYLAKRRRTYRTVRDVPSPPLDEEILDHLQRGELPPPDYGYTIVRDRQPASTSGRGRPPCVHKCTIIELHLEVLNECEAAEWENVKDDYLQILVDEFAPDLQQDANGHSRSLDSPSTHQDLSGNNVSSMLDPPTDIDATNRLPPNEHDHDPWKCMETIQLEQDTSPPNEEHRWSCMESIQLPTDTFPPNDCDPWSCMETIPLQTDPCPPNEDDSDAWKCMETI